MIAQSTEDKYVLNLSYVWSVCLCVQLLTTDLNLAHWAVVLVDYSIHYVAISIAWTLQRLVSSVHSAIRGGLMFSRNIMEYTTIMGIYQIDHENSILDELIGYGVAALGVLFQLSIRFVIPFPFNILLLPLTILDRLLMWMVNE